VTDRDFKNLELEAEVIKQTYAMTVEPHRLEDFESFWEQFVDANITDEMAESGNLQDTAIATHVVRALEIIERLRVHPGKVEDAQSIVDANFGFAIIVDLTGRIVVKNTEARSTLPEERQLSETIWDRDSIERIETWLGRLGRSNDPSGLFVHLWLGDDDRKTCLFLTPLNLSAAPNSTPADHALITSVDIEISPDALSAIQDAFQLTEAEAHVAMHLANGKSPTEIAQLRNATINTVRTQIKQTLTKTDSQGIADLVRRICAMAGRFVAVSSQAKLLAERMRTAGEFRTGSMTLADGRYLEYLEMGHPRGKPVLHCHQVMEGPKWTPTAARTLALAGIRVIAPWRPGYGNSDANPLASYQAILNSHSNDLWQLCEHLNIQQVVASGASRQAQALALARPDLVKAMLLVNSVPIWHRGILSHYTPRARRLIKTSLYAPKLLPYAPRVAKILIDSGRERIFIESLVSGNVVDQEAMNDREVYETFADYLRTAVKQGLRAYCQDIEGVHTDLSEKASHVRCPVTLLLGKANSHHPVVEGERYRQFVPHAKVRIIDGAGTYLLATHPDIVVEELRQLCAMHLTVANS
jgi:pimeloyl-ACP methyl ester carboxylesterase/DNA-binding CsgD family transcriptional regulator